MTISLKRIANVTAMISALGAVCGVILGSLAFWVELWRLPGTTSPNDLSRVVLVGVVGGALFGAVLAPIIAWIFLRRVSLGRAIGETSLGVLAGIAVGAVVQPSMTIYFALSGFVVSAARMWAVAPEPFAREEHGRANATLTTRSHLTRGRGSR